MSSKGFLQLYVQCRLAIRLQPHGFKWEQKNKSTEIWTAINIENSPPNLDSGETAAFNDEIKEWSQCHKLRGVVWCLLVYCMNYNYLCVLPGRYMRTLYLIDWAHMPIWLFWTQRRKAPWTNIQYTICYGGFLPKNRSTKNHCWLNLPQFLTLSSQIIVYAVIELCLIWQRLEGRENALMNISLHRYLNYL